MPSEWHHIYRLLASVPAAGQLNWAQMFGQLSNILIRLSPIKYSEFITNILKIGHSQKFGTLGKMSII